MNCVTFTRTRCIRFKSQTHKNISITISTNISTVLQRKKISPTQNLPFFHLKMLFCSILKRKLIESHHEKQTPCDRNFLNNTNHSFRALKNKTLLCKNGSCTISAQDSLSGRILFEEDSKIALISPGKIIPKSCSIKNFAAPFSNPVMKVNYDCISLLKPTFIVAPE
jgi:hypothetical protein